MDYDELMRLEAKVANMCGLEFKTLVPPASRKIDRTTWQNEIRPEDGKPKGSTYQDQEIKRIAMSRMTSEARKRIRADPFRGDYLREKERQWQANRTARLSNAEKQARRDRNARRTRERYASETGFRERSLARQKAWRDLDREGYNARVRQRRKDNPELHAKFNATRRTKNLLARLKALEELTFDKLFAKDFELYNTHIDGTVSSMSFVEFKDRMFALRKAKGK